MARSRRSYRRSTSQRAVSLFASVLPAPLQRIAETQFGSTVLMLGIPALILAGILQLEWNGGFPQLKIDRDRAQEIRNAAREEISRIGSPETAETIQRIERSAFDLWNAAQGNNPGNYPTQTYPPNTAYPAPPYAANGYPAGYPQLNGGFDYRAVSQQFPLPSSSVARSSNSQSPLPSAMGPNSYPNASNYYQPPIAQPAYQPLANYPPNPHALYYQQPPYQQPQPAYYWPPATTNNQPPLTQQPTTGRALRY